MKVTHNFTSQTRQGWITVVSVTKDEEKYALVISHDNKVRPVVKSTLDEITAAMSKQTILDQREIIDQTAAQKIEEPLVNWLSANEGTMFHIIRWRDEQMHGFESQVAADEFEKSKPPSAPREARARKKTFMIG